MKKRSKKLLLNSVGNAQPIDPRTPSLISCEAFRQDGIKAWDDHRTTGLHATMDEADAWLAKLAATDQDVAPPETHN